MDDSKTNKQIIERLEESLRHLIEYIQTIEDPGERQASVAFLVVNLISQNCSEVEGLGILEKIKHLLCEAKASSTDQCRRLMPLVYIS